MQPTRFSAPLRSIGFGKGLGQSLIFQREGPSWALNFRGRASTLALVSNFKVNLLTQRRRLLLWPLWMLMRLWVRTTRVRLDAADEARLRNTSRPTVIVFWHNGLFVADTVYRHHRSPHITYGLVSASKDGAWLAAFFDLVGLRAVRGSSSRGGREALRDLREKLNEGHDVALTPDGPRGPAHSFKPGAAILIRQSRARVLLVGYTFSAAWRLRSWDRFILPRPFSSIRIRTRIMEPEELPSDLTACTKTLRRALTELNDVAPGD